MPTRRKTSAAKPRKRNTSAKGTRRRASKSSVKKGLKKRVSRAATPVKRVAKTALAGAVSGAMRALAPEIKKVANRIGRQSKQSTGGKK